MKEQSDRIHNYEKLVDDQVELVLFVDLEREQYEIVHDAGRLAWGLEPHGDYAAFVKYIEKHIEDEEEKNVLQNMFSTQNFQRSDCKEEAVEKEFFITMQGRYEWISLLRYQMEALPGYEHTGVLVIRLLTPQKQIKLQQAALYQTAGILCQAVALVQLQENWVNLLLLPEYIKEQMPNLPKTYDGFVHDLLQFIHVQDQDIVKHILSKSYLESKMTERSELAVQVRCKGEDDAFRDIDIICHRIEKNVVQTGISFVLLIKNITEEKKLIDQLQQQIQELESKLDEAKEEKEELCSMIAKELHRR